MFDIAEKTWTSWAAWNDEYTALLRKRNAAQRKMSPYGATDRQHAAVHKAELAVTQHCEHPNRPSSRASRIF